LMMRQSNNLMPTLAADFAQPAPSNNMSIMQSAVQFGGEQQRNFSPYADNGGSIVAVGGKGYVIIASDTRLSSGYSILTRDQPKLFQLTNQTILGSTGCWCDILTFTRILEARLKMYKYEHNRVLTTPAASQLVTNMLYFRRFFPYYISNVLAGLDADGEGIVYSYDPIGHCERSKYRAGGSSAALLQPLLDNQIGLKNIENPDASRKDLSKDEALKIVKDVFISASERDIYCGDGLIIKTITPEGVVSERFELRKD